MGLLPPETLAQAAGLLHGLQARDITLATAESCTGGLVAAVVTAIPGSSATLLAGFVTYSNEAKMRMLGIPAETLERVGAVSEAVARGMAEGALHASGAGLALSTTGIAGPGGGSVEKPVGLVFIGAALRDGPSLVRRCVFPGDRDAVRAATVVAALDLAVEIVGLDSAVASKPGR